MLPVVPIMMRIFIFLFLLCLFCEKLLQCIWGKANEGQVQRQVQKANLGLGGGSFTSGLGNLCGIKSASLPRGLVPLGTS